MNIILAKYHGFCYGVKRAVGMAQENRRVDAPAYTLGPIIHNPQMVERLAGEGVGMISDVSEIDSGTIIIRSHGVGPAVYEEAKQRGLNVVDATCPHVKKAQLAANALVSEGYRTVIIGEQHHPEVRSIFEWSDRKAFIVETVEEAVEIDNCEKLGIVAQTTFSREKFKDIVMALLDKSNHVKIERTICNATEQRQAAAIELAGQVDVMLVIGGKNSANTTRLAQLCQSTGCVTHHIETAAELDRAWFDGVDAVGITAGASTPDWLIDEVRQYLAELPENEWYEEPKPLEVGDVVEAVVKEAVKGGLVIELTPPGRGFIPASHVDLKYVEDLAGYVGQTVKVKAIEIDGANNRNVFSRRAVLNDEREAREAALLDKIKAGQTVNGVVSKVESYGAFVDIGGIDGLVHVSEMSWHRVDRPQDVLSVGDAVVVKVKACDRASKRLSLSIKALTEDPWLAQAAAFKEGTCIEAEVAKIIDSGIIVTLAPEVDGFVHISDLSEKRLNRADELVKVGQSLRLKITQIDKKKKRIRLSLLEAQQDSERDEYRAYMKQHAQDDSINTIGVKFAHLFKEYSD